MALTKVGNEFIVGSAGLLAAGVPGGAATLTNGNVVVAYTETLLFPSGGLTDTDGSVLFQLLDDTFFKDAAATQIYTVTAGVQTDPHVAALSGGGFVVSWTTNAQLGAGNDDTDIITRIFDNSGTAVTGEIVITVDAPTPASPLDDNVLSDIVALAGGGYAVIWSDVVQGATAGDFIAQAVMQTFDSSGTAASGEVVVATDGTFRPDVIQLVNGDVVVVDEALPDINIRLSNAALAGAPAGVSGAIGPVTITTAPPVSAVTMFGPEIAALSGGGFVVAYRYTDNAANDLLRVETFDAAGNQSSASEFASTSTIFSLTQNDYSVIGLDDGGFALLYIDEDTDQTGIFLRAFDANGNANGSLERVNDTEFGAQVFPTMTKLDDGNILVAFQDQSSFPIGQVVDTLHGVIFEVTAGNTGGPIVGDENDNVLDGTASDDLIQGLAGDDTLTGSVGNDVLEGGDDDDALYGGPGNDTLNGGDGQDGAFYTFSSGPVQVFLNKGYATGASGRDTIISIETVTGSEFNDVIIGNGETNGLIGFDGDDIIRTKGGNDQVDAGAGNDSVFGDDGDENINAGIGDDVVKAGQGNDTILGIMGEDIIRAGQGNDIAFGGTEDDRLFGNGGDDELHGDEGNDRLEGGNNSDTLTGGDGDDSLKGGSGRDSLSGNDGDDNLFGGTSRDVFVFEDSINMGRDRVKDWEDGLDTLDLSDFGFANFAALDTLKSDQNGNLKIDFGGGNLIVVENFDINFFDATDVVLV